MIFNTRLGRFFVVDSLRLDLARPIEEINSALQPIFELIFLFFTAVLCRSKHVWTRIGPWGSQCLPLPWGSATLQASIKLHSFNLKITIKHLQHPRQHQLFQNLIEVANEVNSSAKLDSWTKRTFCSPNTAKQVHESLGRVEGRVAHLEPEKAWELDGMELYMNFIEFHDLSVTLKLNIFPKVPRIIFFVAIQPSGAVPQATARNFGKVWIGSTSMEIGWSGSRDEWGDSKSLSGHPWCGWSEAISFWIWQGRPCYAMLCHAIHCPHFSWKRLKSHHLYTCWESCRIWTLQKCVISWQLFERARWRCTASERSYYC